ncbi:MAG: protein kinase [Planctomycetaceae bacterium]
MKRVETAKPSSKWIWPFELLEQIGEGGMGVVYRARYVVKDFEVALKMLPADVRDGTTLARFEREMDVLKTMRHPNIVRCFGGTCEDKQRFYAMELVTGGSLDDLLQQRGKLSWEAVIEYGLQMCAALDYSHSKGVVHRDVKPSNFLIAKDGHLRLSDFGLASVATNQRITRAGRTAGTFLYMAPEQIRGSDITPQTDLYALGCVFFELLTGQPPFVGETPAATLHMHCKSTPPRITEFSIDCPPALERLTLRLLEKKPMDRPATAMEVAQELRGISTKIEVVPRVRSLENRQPGNVPTPDTEKADTAKTVSHLPLSTFLRPKWQQWLQWGSVAAATLFFIWICILLSGRTSLRRGNELWLEASRSPSIEVRSEAATALGKLGGPDYLARVAEMLEHDENVNVRIAAAEAIGSVGEEAKSHTPLLMRLQKSEPDERLRMAVSMALGRIKSGE